MEEEKKNLSSSSSSSMKNILLGLSPPEGELRMIPNSNLNLPPPSELKYYGRYNELKDFFHNKLKPLLCKIIKDDIDPNVWSKFMNYLDDFFYVPPPTSRELKDGSLSPRKAVTVADVKAMWFNSLMWCPGTSPLSFSKKSLMPRKYQEEVTNLFEQFIELWGQHHGHYGSLLESSSQSNTTNTNSSSSVSTSTNEQSQSMCPKLETSTSTTSTFGAR
jgi:hypothetical protein